LTISTPSSAPLASKPPDGHANGNKILVRRFITA
jgi:hypothetical protein